MPFVYLFQFVMFLLKQKILMYLAPSIHPNYYFLCVVLSKSPILLFVTCDWPILSLLNLSHIDLWGKSF